MKTKSLLFSFFIAAMLCIVGSNNAWGAGANRYYKCAITSDVTVTLTGVTQNKFTVTFSQKGKNTNEYSTKPTGGIYGTSVQLVLESKDRTLEGTYSSINKSGDDKINCTASASGSYVLNGTTKRYIRTGASAPTSTFTIEKDGSGNYYIGEGTLCVYQSSDNYTYYYNYIEDDLLTEGIDPVSQAFDYIPLSDCSAPTALTNTALGATSASFSWTSSESTWQYVCLPSATTLTDALWTTNKVSVNTKSATVTGLSPETEYTFYVLSDCGGDGTSAITSTEITIPCSVISSIPWSENFNACTNNVTPPCWRQLKTGNGYVQATTAYYRGASGKSMRIAGGTSGSTGLAVFPQFEDDIKNLSLTFYYRGNADDEYYTYGKPQVGYITNPASMGTFVAVETLDQVNNAWTKKEGFTVPANTPDGAYFAIRFFGTGSSIGYTHIDDITVSEKPSCKRPTNVAVTDDSETDEGATITWDANGMTAWVMQVSESDASSWGDDIEVDDNEKVLTGLKANTLYYVRVKATCDEIGDSEWSDNVFFTTLCGTINVNSSTPWSMNFQGLSENIIPECWDNSASTTTSSWGDEYIWGTFNDNGNVVLRMSNGFLDGGIALINTPGITIPDDGKTYELTFDYSVKTIAGNNMLVKISANGGVFTQKGIYYSEGAASTPGEFNTATISLDGYNGQTIKVQFFANPTSGTASTDGAMFVDNISIHKELTCFQPTALTAGGLTANSAHMTWTASGSETAWRLQYRADGGSWSAEQSVSTNAQYDIESLSANTLYYIRVKAYCDAEDQSEWSEVASFTTLCAAESMPFSEEFNSASELPSCWEATPASGTYRWMAGQTGDNYYARLYTNSVGKAELRMIPVSLSENAILRFEWKNESGVKVNIYISTNGGLTKTLIPNDLSNVHSDWTTKIYDLSAYTGETALIYFIADLTTMNQNVYLDDVKVIARPCNLIMNIQAAPITEGATISWTGNVKKVRYKTGSDAWSYATIESANYAGPKTITGLTPASSYQACLLPACSEEEEANWTEPLFFVTSSAESVPYSNNFESETEGELPFNWNKISLTEYPQISYDAYAYREPGQSKGHSIKFFGGNDQIIVLPEFDADLADLAISFHYRNSKCKMELGYVAADGVTFTAIETLPNQGAYDEFPYEKDLIELSSDAYKLAIRFSEASDASAQAYVDNVLVKTPTCGQPIGLTYDNLTANSIHISWSASVRGLEENYLYIIRPWSLEAGDPNWGSAHSIANNVYELNLNNLSGNTEYEFYMRSNCEESEQSIPLYLRFETLMSDEVFEDAASATDNETRLAALKEAKKAINIIINRPLLLNGDYCTLCLPFNLSTGQIADPGCPLHDFVIKEFEMSRESSGEVNIYLNQVKSIEAGKPYFVRYAGEPSDELLTPMTFSGVEIQLSSPVDEESDDACTPHGVFNPYPLVKDDVSTLFLSSNNTLYYPSANGTMNGFRAYIKVGGALSAPIRRGAPIRIVEKENTTTGIENGAFMNGDASLNGAIQKILRDGQIIIIRGEHMYNAQGMRIQ